MPITKNLENLSPNIGQYARSILTQDGTALSRAISSLGLHSQLDSLQAAGWISADIESQEIAPALAKSAALGLLKGISIDNTTENTLRVFLAIEFFYKALPNGMLPSFNLFTRDMLRETLKEPELSLTSNAIQQTLKSYTDYLIDADHIEILEGVIDLPHMHHENAKNFIDILIFKEKLTNTTPKMQSMLSKLVSKLKKAEEMELIESARREGLDSLAIAILDHRASKISLVDEPLDNVIFIIENTLKSHNPHTKSEILNAVNSAYTKSPFSTFQYDHKLLLTMIKFSNSLHAYNMPFFNAWDTFELADRLVSLYNDQTISAEDKAHIKAFYNSYIATYQSIPVAKDMSNFVSTTMNNGVDVYAEEQDISRYESKTSKMLNILDFDSIHQLKQSDPDINLMSILVKFFVKAGDIMVSEPSKSHYIKSFMHSLNSMKDHSSIHKEDAAKIAPEKAPSLLSKIFSKIVGSQDVSSSRER